MLNLPKLKRNCAAASKKLNRNMAYDSTNIFAKILRGEIPCKPIYQSEHALAFHDINPHRKIHALVIPKGAYSDFSDFANHASAAEIVEFAKAVAETAKLLGVTQSGYRLISNSGVDSGQEVPHYHVHILGGEAVGPLVSKS